MKYLCRWMLVGACMFGQSAARERNSANVKVIVSETFGRPLLGAKVTLTSVVPGEHFAGMGERAQFEQIPYGVYDLDVRLPGFVDHTERIDIQYPVLLFRIGLELGTNDSYERSELTGSVKPEVKGRQGLWVRLMPLYGSALIENAVNDSGKFELDGVAHGKYLLILFEGNKLLSAKQIDVLGGKQIVEVVLEP